MDRKEFPKSIEKSQQHGLINAEQMGECDKLDELYRKEQMLPHDDKLEE